MERKNNLSVKENALQNGKELLHAIKRDSATAKHKFISVITDQPLIKALREQLEQKKVDLIVMGTKGKSGFAERLFGSNSIAVIKNITETPILIIPREIDFQKPKTIDFATDFEITHTDSEFNLLKTIQQEYNSKIRFIHSGNDMELSDKNRKNLNQLKKIFKVSETVVDYLPTDLEISRAIAEHVKQNHVNLLSMVKFKHKHWEFFREPVIKELNMHLRFPFLMLPSKIVK